ncbi:nematode resistance protein-like HSPRO2 [Silene latifolia]|uniref:nematode resistance protein-like HSPRO2 n=1 Tax=Silene latifolia TaxID=37657 RepID=UPI003D76D11A
MVDYDCKTKMVHKSPKLTTKRAMSATFPSPEKPATTATNDLSPATDISCSAYESYLRLPELRQLWSSTEFPGWESESVIKPALQALEITFRFISVVLSDPRPYSNRREWDRRLESLSRDQVELISILCEEDESRDAAPIIDVTTSFGEVVPQTGSSAEVWKLSLGCNEHTVVSRTSESSLLPRLVTWQKSEAISDRILYSIESAMKRCVFTLGLGEPNLDGKPNLNYDAVCRPDELHALKKSAMEHVSNYENKVIFTIHQILESWIFVAKKLLERIEVRINKEEYSKVADDCWILEKIWKLLEQIENLHLLMDPNDFLHLKTQLRMKSTNQNDTFCFRSKGLVEITKMSKELRHKVPEILGVEVDPMGGPRIQEAAMGLYRERRRFEKVHVLQAFQGIESALKGFFFNYKQLLVIMMGSLEANGNNSGGIGTGSSDLLSQLFLEPTYYPSLDGAKTFIGDFWEHDQSAAASGGDVRSRNRAGKR